MITTNENDDCNDNDTVVTLVLCGKDLKIE